MRIEYKKLSIDILIFSFGVIGSKFILFLLLPLYTNVLLPSEYATADLIYTSVQLLMPIASLAIYNGELRYGLEKDIDKSKVMSHANFVYILALIILFPLVQLLRSYTLLTDWIYYIYFYVAAMLFCHIFNIGLKIYEKNKYYSISCMLQALLLGSFNILFLVFYTLKIKGYVISLILSFFIVPLFMALVFKLRIFYFYKKLDNLLLKKMVVFSIPFVFNDISWWIIHATDKYMLGQLVGLHILGLYSTASKIPSLINAISGIFSQAWTISAIKEYNNTSNNKYFSDILKKYYIFIYGILIISVSFIKKFMSFYVSDAYFDSYRFVPTLLLAASFGAISAYTISVFSAYEKSKLIMKNTMIAAITNIVFNYILISYFGVWGAIYATLISYIILLYLNMKNLETVRKININKNCFLSLTLLSIIQVICVTNDIYDNYVSCISICTFIFIARFELLNIKRIVCNHYKKYINF